jgi:catechol 2,3-dioxygenase-like lactoylglutathione lyase family enzyme
MEMIFEMRRWWAFGGCLMALIVGTAAAEDVASPTQVDHLNIVFSVTDAAAVHEFYGEILGLERLDDIQFPGDQYMIRYLAGESEVKFIVTGQDLPKMSGRAGDARGIRLLALLLPMKEQAGILERLADAGRNVPEITVRTNAAGEFRYAFGMVYDGDGNQVEIVFLGESTPEAVFQQAQIGLSVSSHAPMDEFLSKVLQYQPVVTEGAIHRYDMGKSQLKFWEVAADLPAWNGSPTEKIGMNLVQALVDDVEAARSAIVARGGRIHTEPFALGTLATIMFVEGPDGILFEFAGPLLERFKQ